MLKKQIPEKHEKKIPIFYKEIAKYFIQQVLLADKATCVRRDRKHPDRLIYTRPFPNPTGFEKKLL